MDDWNHAYGKPEAAKALASSQPDFESHDFAAASILRTSSGSSGSVTRKHPFQWSMGCTNRMADDMVEQIEAAVPRRG